LTSHHGQYVAIHDEQVVDSGDDRLPLALRVLAKGGNISIHVGRITEESEVVARSGFAVSYAPPGAPCDTVHVRQTISAPGSVRSSYMRGR
jgi:hypothetical protein